MATLLNTLSCNWKVIVWQMKELKHLPMTELDHLLSQFFFNTSRQNGQEYEPATISNFQRSPEWKEASNCCRQWRGQLILRLLLNQLCRSLNDFHSNQLWLFFIHILWCVSSKIFQDRQKPFSAFQQPDAAIETSVKSLYDSFLKSCSYSTWFTLGLLQ